MALDERIGMIQLQIQSIEGVKHLLEQEEYGFKNGATEAARISLGFPAGTSREDILEGIAAYVEGLKEQMESIRQQTSGPTLGSPDN